jgi:hypothetical protein
MTTTTETTSKTPVIKFLKLKSSESIIAMVEIDDESESITIYNPLKLIVAGEGYPTAVSGSRKVPVMMEEWLPTQIVSEQMCIIFPDDVITMVDVSEEFAAGYTSAIMRKVQLEELARSRFASGEGSPLDDMDLINETLEGIDEEGRSIIVDGDEQGQQQDTAEDTIEKALAAMRKKFN